MLQDIRLGLLGAGRWGQRYIATIQNVDSVSLSAVFSRNPATQGLVPPGCVIESDWEKLAHAGNLDGIIVATPPATHCDIVCAALKAGVPVLVEKPLALSSEEAAKIAETSRATRRAVMVDHTHLFGPAFRALKAQVAAMGPIRSIEAEAGNNGPVRPDTTMLLDWAPHDIAMCLDLLGNQAAMKYVLRHASPGDPAGHADDIEFGLEFPSNATARIRVSNIRKDKCRWFRVNCERGWAIYDDLAALKLRTGEAGDDVGRSVFLAPDMPLSVVVAEFAQLCRSGASSHPSLMQGVACVRLIEEIAAAVPDAAMPSDLSPFWRRPFTR